MTQNIFQTCEPHKAPQVDILPVLQIHKTKQQLVSLNEALKSGSAWKCDSKIGIAGLHIYYVSVIQVAN